MSEKLNKDWLRTVMPTATILNDDVLCAEMLTIAAAAEERGRRAGIEEAAKLLDAKIAAQKSFSYYVTDPRGGVSRQEGPHDLLLSARGIAMEIRSLAPRDSGKEPAKMDATGGPRCWCGRLSVSESGWCGGCESSTEPA